MLEKTTELVCFSDKFTKGLEELKNDILNLKNIPSSEIEEEKSEIFKYIFKNINNYMDFSSKDYYYIDDMLNSFLSFKEIEDLLVKHIKYIAFHIKNIEVWNYLLKISNTETLIKQNNEDMTLFHYFVLWVDSYIQDDSLRLYVLEDPVEIVVRPKNNLPKNTSVTTKTSPLNNFVNNNSINNHIIIMGKSGTGKSVFLYDEEADSELLFKRIINMKQTNSINLYKVDEIIFKFNSFENFKMIENIKNKNGNTAYELAKNPSGLRLRSLSLNIQLDNKLRNEKGIKSIQKI